MLNNNHELYAMARYTLTKNNFEQDDDIIQELVLYALENEKYFDESKGGRWEYYIFFAMQRRLLQICEAKYRKKRWNGLIPHSLDYEYQGDDKTVIHLYDLIPDTYNFKDEFHKQELINELMELVEEPLMLWLQGWTYVDIGKKFGYSKTYAAIVIKNNIEKIKKYCERRKIECNIY